MPITERGGGGSLHIISNQHQTSSGNDGSLFIMLRVFLFYVLYFFSVKSFTITEKILVCDYFSPISFVFIHYDGMLHFGVDDDDVKKSKFSHVNNFFLEHSIKPPHMMRRQEINPK